MDLSGWADTDDHRFHVVADDRGQVVQPFVISRDVAEAEATARARAERRPFVVQEWIYDRWSDESRLTGVVFRARTGTRGA